MPILGCATPCTQYGMASAGYDWTTDHQVAVIWQGPKGLSDYAVLTLARVSEEC